MYLSAMRGDVTASMSLSGDDTVAVAPECVGVGVSGTMVEPVDGMSSVPADDVGSST